MTTLIFLAVTALIVSFCSAHLVAATGKVALAVQGGGFRAQSESAGLVAGLLAYIKQKSNSFAPTLESTGLLKRFDILSSNSGGSWFTSSLVYSSLYLSTVESMAASPENASEIHSARYTKPFLTATKVIGSDFDWRDEMARRATSKVIGMDNSTLVGGPVNAWAQGKEWYAAHSVLLPSLKEAAYLHRGAGLGRLPTVYMHRDGDAPVSLPATFSVRLGAGTDKGSTTAYVSKASAKNVTDLSYGATITPIVDEPKAVAKDLGAVDFCDGALTANVGALPVRGVAAASSAFGGIAPTLGTLVDETIALTDADLLPWVTNAPNGAAFLDGTRLYEGLSKRVDKSAIQELAATQFHGLIDGAYTDNTAIAQAVAGGADEVTAIINTNSTATPTSLALLFKDGPAPSDPGSSAVIYPVFASPVGPTVDTDIQRKFKHLFLPNSTFVKMFAVGSINAVTAANEYWGITPGRSIKINVIDIGSVLSIGLLEKIENYDHFVQHIIEAISAPANADIVNDVLLPMFTGSTVKQSITMI